MVRLSVCGIECDICKFKAEKNCMGCQQIKGNVFWGKCELYSCCEEKSLSDCGQCGEFPCEKLKRWAASENPERIENLRKNRTVNR